VKPAIRPKVKGPEDTRYIDKTILKEQILET